MSETSLAIIVAVIAAVPPMLLSLVVLYQSRKTRHLSQETHNLVNSRMTEMLEISRNLAAANATLAEKKAEADRQKKE